MNSYTITFTASNELAIYKIFTLAISYSNSLKITLFSTIAKILLLFRNAYLESAVQFLIFETILLSNLAIFTAYSLSRRTLLFQDTHLVVLSGYF